MLAAISTSLVLVLGCPVQEPAPQPEPSLDNDALVKLVREAGSLVPWLRDPFEQHDIHRRAGGRQPYNPPVARAELLDAALRRAQGEGRLVLAYVWRIEGRQMYRAPLLDDYMRLTAFSDPELADLIARRFVPLRLYADRHVAKRLGFYNADPNDPLYLAGVEPALVFLRPDGSVAHTVQRIRTFSSHWLRHVLKTVLRREAAHAAPSALVRALEAGLPEGKPDPLALVYLAAEQCRDGEEEKALASLTRAASPLRERYEADARRLADLEAQSPAEGQRRRGGDAQRRGLEQRRSEAEEAMLTLQLTRAKAERLLRRGEQALASLELARQELGTAAQGPAVALEEARILLALGRPVEAQRALEDAGKSGEACWLRATAAQLQWQESEALAHCRQALAAGEPPFAARAAAMLAKSDDTTSLSPLAHGFEVLAYGPDVIYGDELPASSEITRRAAPAEAKPAIAKAAVDYLLAQQRPDGSWADARYAYWPEPKILPNVRVAVTALAATALLAWRDLEPERVQAALDRAERYLRDDGRLALGTEEEVYSQAYRMLYWARKSVFGLGSKPDNFANLEALAKRAKEIQDPQSGFFAHEYKNAFCTGAMLWSLHLAKALGAQVGDDVVQLGVKALLSARRDDGSYSYGGTAEQRDRSSPPAVGARGGQSITHLKDASARMPVCETVLQAFGASDPQKVAKAFETFLGYLDRIAKVRKCDFHSDGELAGFFFWHAIFHASEAKTALDGELRGRVEARLLDLVTSFPEIDGSFVDSHELGKSYGTAMALLTLKNLSGE